MLKSGLYRYIDDRNYGTIVVDVKETADSFIFHLKESYVRYNAPQIDDMFHESDRVVIKKSGSKHALSFIKNDDTWFCLYPYRVGVPYAFSYIESQE